MSKLLLTVKPKECKGIWLPTAARIWTIPLFQNTAPAVDVRIVVEERSFNIKTNKQKKTPQPLTPLQLEQQSIKYCSLKFKL